MRNAVCLTHTCILLWGCASSVHLAAAPADWERNWPQWRGPLATGTAPQADPPLEWSETKNVKWKVAIPGSGTSTPIIWENRVFILTAIPTGKKIEAVPVPAAPAAPAATPVTNTAAGPGGRGGGGRGGGGGGEKPTEFYQFAVLCLDRQTGKTLWQKVATEEVPHEGHHRDHGFASASPVTDGKHVLAYFGSRGLHCYDMDGNLKWKQDFGDMRIRAGFGEGCSPAMIGDTVIVRWDHEGDDFLVALDKNTGKELWRQTRDEPTNWSTPLIVTHDGKTQIILASTRKTRGYDLATGQVIWEGPNLTENVVPSPVSNDGVVYVMSGFRGNALQAIKLGRTGDVTGSDAILWSHGKSTPYVPSPLLYGDLLYFLSNNNGILSCFDVKTGKPHFEAERLEGIAGVYASPVGARERVYLQGREGKCLVLKNGTRLEILATNTIEDGTDASLALAGKEIFLRGRKNLYCIAEN